MKISDVKRACNAIIQKEFTEDAILTDNGAVRIYGNDSHDGYKRPGFFTEVLRSSYTIPHKKQRGYKFAFIITLLENVHDEAVCLDILDRITDAFGIVVRLKDVVLTVESIEHTWIDTQNDVMQITIDFANMMMVDRRRLTGDLDMMESVDAEYIAYGGQELIAHITDHIEQRG